MFNNFLSTNDFKTLGTTVLLTVKMNVLNQSQETKYVRVHHKRYKK